MSAPIFQRPDLALALSNRLLHPDALQLTSRDGLFLTGVRRIGKTTFIRRDLIPQLEKENALVNIYPQRPDTTARKGKRVGQLH